MAESVRVGLVGASAAGSGWSSVAHIPALHAADTLSGARGSGALAELPLPAELTDGFPAVPPGNVGRAYQHMAEAIMSGQSFGPDFAHAVRVHRLLDLIEQSSAQGTSVSVS